MQDQYQLVLCTCPDQDSAQTIAEYLVDQGLAACVNILPGIQSIYTWQGKRESSQELLLVIKTTKNVYDALEKAIIGVHPYELPEIIAVNIEKGNAGYLSWISDSISTRY
ncbi:MAG: divalent-cation tolerance protein CutA [Gammaproteobacteria bacterium]